MITVILAEPEHPGNIGAVCRVMANFGLSELILIDPKCSITQESKNLSKHGFSILEKARIASWDVLEEFKVVAATAGKPTTQNNLPRSPLSPKQAAQKLASAKKVAILFGRESAGLTNKEISLCDFVVMIPAARGHESLNLSHAVAIVLYELHIAQPLPTFTPASREDRKTLDKKLAKLVAELPFSTPGKRTHQISVWKQIFGRAMLTKREAFAALGLFSAIEKREMLRKRKSK